MSNASIKGFIGVWEYIRHLVDFLLVEFETFTRSIGYSSSTTNWSASRRFIPCSIQRSMLKAASQLKQIRDGADETANDENARENNRRFVMTDKT